MVYNSINFNMIPVGDRRAAHAASERAGERADNRLFFLYALYKRKLCTINLAEREKERASSGGGNDNCSDNAKDTNQKAAAAAEAAKIAAQTKTTLRGQLLLFFFFFEFF